MTIDMPRLGAALAAAVLLVTPAQAGAAEPDASRERAAQLVAEGVELARAKDFAAAIPKFEEANRLFPHPEIQHSLARAHEELGQLRTAHHWFGLALRQDYTYAADARERIAAIEAELRKSHARLTVRATPSGVRVALKYADGSEETNLTTPFETWAVAGPLRITASSPEFKALARTIELTRGEDRQVNLVLEPLPKQGFFQVVATVAGAKVLLSDVLIGTLPMQSVTYPAGVYELQVRAVGFQTHRRQVVIEPDELTQVTVALEPDVPEGPEGPVGVVTPPPEVEPPSGAPTWIGPTLVGLGLVAGIVGGVLHAEAHRINGEANQIPLPTPPDPVDLEAEARYERLFQNASDHQTMAIGSYIGGGAFVLIGVILIATAGDDDATGVDGAKAAAQWTPAMAVTGDGATGGVLVRF